MAKIVPLKTSIKSLKDKLAFYGAIENNVETELATVMTEYTRLVQLFYSTRAEMVGLQENLAAINFLTEFVVDDLYANIDPYLRGSLENARASFNKSVLSRSCSFHQRSTPCRYRHRWYHPFSGGAESEDGEGFTESEDVVDLSANTVLILL